MKQTPAIGIQNFEKIITENRFYVDKTSFIREWWETGDDVTLITRPRRFGKTLNMSMLECFFSNKYQGRGDLFEGLSIWESEEYRELQGSFPVIALSFANVKDSRFSDAKLAFGQIIAGVYRQHGYLCESEKLFEADRRWVQDIIDSNGKLEDAFLKTALQRLSACLEQHYGKKPLIFLDEYDTPMQEAYVGGYWDEMTDLIRTMFNSTFKTNPSLGRAVLTGITRVSKESIFSDLNNLNVVTTTSGQYMTAYGFTEEEVFAALDEHGLGNQKDEVKRWYDGFIFGTTKDIYNPWSILNFIAKREFSTYWANTSSNSLVGKLIRESNPDVKMSIETLLDGKCIQAKIDEQIVFNQLDGNVNAIWSLLLASGYLKVERRDFSPRTGISEYHLSLTNFEVRITFEGMIETWFKDAGTGYNEFIRALLMGDVKSMNKYMNCIALKSFSFFDSGNHPSEKTEPERFYHGFVLGLIVELRDRYVIRSNRESGFGRYDVMLEPRERGRLHPIILEFKVFDADEEESLKDTVQAALKQIEEKQYDAELVSRGFPAADIRHYGFAFEGKTVLIG